MALALLLAGEDDKSLLLDLTEDTKDNVALGIGIGHKLIKLYFDKL